jgi:hypothetical protein
MEDEDQDQSPLGHWGVMARASNPPDKRGEVAVRIGHQSHRYEARSAKFVGVGVEVQVTEMHDDGSVTVAIED